MVPLFYLNNMRIFLDVDDVIFDWHPDYAKRFNVEVPKKWDYSQTMTDRILTLAKDKNYWLTLTLKNRPNFTPKGFVSARGIPKAWTVESLKINNIPGRSHVHHVPWNISKIDTLKKLKCELFIDDKIETFEDCLKNGIPCLLMNAPHNTFYDTPYRVYSLDIKEIKQLYDRLF